MSVSLRALMAALAATPAVVAAPMAAAQDARAFTIAPGPLDAALGRFAEQSGLQLLYTAETTRGLRSPGVTGRLAPTAALDRLLVGTGLSWSQSRPGVLVVRRPDALAPDTAQVEDVIVTGSLIRGPGQTPSPIVTLTRSDLDQQGHATVADALVGLPQAYAGSATPVTLLTQSDPIGSNGVLATGVNLRGLGEDATLVLVDGRRLAGVGSRAEFADVSAIPNAAVERVDVLLDGASALYGSDAVGGVVNVILRDRVDGQESRVRVAAARGGGEDLIVSHLAGATWSSGSAVISYEYQDRGALGSGDRAYSATGDGRPFGGTDRRAFFSSPGNLVRFDAPTAAYVVTHAIQPTATGTTFVRGATNLANRRQGVDLLPDVRRHAVFARVRQDLSDRVGLSADLRFSDRTFRYRTLSLASIYTVTNRNPFFRSPTGATSHTVAYNFIDDIGNPDTLGASRSLGVTAGLDVALPRDWSLDAYVAFAEERGRTEVTGSANSTFLSEALGTVADNPATAYSAVRDGYLNLFGGGGANTAAVLDFISQGYVANLYRGRSASANVLAQGAAWRLPGGEVKLALGAQVRREVFRSVRESFTSGVSPLVTVADPQTRDIAAVFAEARIPLFSAENARPGLQALEVSLAVRTETYDDVGSTTNPKVGIVWSPVGGLRARATWSTAFRAPSLSEVFSRPGFGSATLQDAGGARLAIQLTGGNLDLRPETAETFTAGFDLGPARGWQLGATYFETRFKDRIGRPALDNIANVLTDPSLAPFVTRLDPTRPADLALIRGYLADPRFLSPDLYPATAYSVVFDARYANTGELFVRGLDATLSRPIELGDHHLELTASVSWLLEYSRKLTPVARREQLLDTVGFPIDLRGQVAANWRWKDFGARISATYVDAYRDAAGSTIDAFASLDGQLRWTPDRLAGLEGAELLLTVQNLTDAAPPFYDGPIGFGFDAAGASPLGRVVSLQLIKRW